MRPASGQIIRFSGAIPMLAFAFVAGCDSRTHSTQPTPGVTVGFDSSSVTTAVGEEFTLAVEVENVTGLFGAAFEVVFDSGILTARTNSQGDFLGSAQLYYSNVDTASVSVACSRMSDDGGVSGSGSLATITFDAAATGTSSVGIVEYKLTLEQEDGTSIAVETLGACEVVVTLGQ